MNLFRASFQFLIGMVHFLDASMIARYTTFLAELSEGNNYLFLIALRMTLLSDSIALVASVALISVAHQGGEPAKVV